jgi:hypothetical protein
MLAKYIIQRTRSMKRSTQKIRKRSIEARQERFCELFIAIDLG